MEHIFLCRHLSIRVHVKEVARNHEARLLHVHSLAKYKGEEMKVCCKQATLRWTPTGSHAGSTAPIPPTFFFFFSQAVAKVTAKAEF